MRQRVHHLLWDIMKVDQDMSYKCQLLRALLWLGHYVVFVWKLKSWVHSPGLFWRWDQNFGLWSDLSVLTIFYTGRHSIFCNHWRVLLLRTNNNLYGSASHLSHNARKMMQSLLVHCKALLHHLELWDEEQRSHSSCQPTTSLISFQV